MNITILGSGSWGTALSFLLAHAPAATNASITLYGIDRSQIDSINEQRENADYLPGIQLPQNIRATCDLAEAATSGTDLVLFVVPSSVTRLVAEQMRSLDTLPAETMLLSCSKGIEKDTGERMTEVIGDFFPDNPIAALSGPTHAEEIGKKLPTAAVIGSQDHAVAQRLQEIFTTPWFRTYTSDDVAGIEVGGTIKNVFAIAAGICESLGLGDNAKAAMVTRSLAEMIRVGITLGGKAETFQGLSGVGDLMVTCYSHHSRNNTVGRMLGEGKTLPAIQDSMSMVAEGVLNAASVYQCARKAGVRTPITDQVHAILYENKPPAQAIEELLSRDPRPETDE